MAYKFLKNSVLNFDTINISDISNVTSTTDENSLNVTNTLDVSFYDRKKIQKIRNIFAYMNDTWFSYTLVQQNSSLEKISLDLYGSKDYWDILLVLNERMPIFDMYYDYDIISEAGETGIQEYENKIYRKKISDSVRERLRVKLQENYERENENLKIIKYIQKDYLYDFLNFLNSSNSKIAIKNEH